MCDVAQNLIRKGEAKGKTEAEVSAITKMAKYFMYNDSSLSRKEAEALAKNILK